MNWIIVVLFSCMQRRSIAGDLISIDLEESRADQKVEGFKQQLVAQPALDPVDTFVELEEIVRKLKLIKKKRHQ